MSNTQNKNEDFRTIRIEKTMAAEIEQIAAKLGERYSVNAFVEQAVRDVLEMAKLKPDQRPLPKLVRLIDAATADNPAVFLKSPSEAKADEVGARLLKKARGEAK